MYKKNIGNIFEMQYKNDLYRDFINYLINKNYVYDSFFSNITEYYYIFIKKFTIDDIVNFFKCQSFYFKEKIEISEQENKRQCLNINHFKNNDEHFKYFKNLLRKNSFIIKREYDYVIFILQNKELIINYIYNNTIIETEQINFIYKIDKSEILNKIIQNNNNYEIYEKEFTHVKLNKNNNINNIINEIKNKYNGLFVDNFINLRNINFI